MAETQPGRNGGTLNRGGAQPGAGRPPKELSITWHIKQALERQDQEGAMALADALVEKAKEGNAAAIREVMDRVDGPVKQKSEVEHSGQVAYIILTPEEAEKI